jgi:cellobiose-specific phosphotransferase system component IIC
VEAFVTPVLIVSIVAILFIVIFSSRRSRKLDARNTPGLFKPVDIIRFAEVALLLVFCIAAYLTAKRIVEPLVGFVLMAVLMLVWIPFQFWQNARLLADEEGVVLCSLWGRVSQLHWQDVRAVRLVAGSVVFMEEGGELRIPGYFSGRDKLLEIIRQHVPNQSE